MDVVAGNGRYHLETIDENKCGKCDEVKKGELVGNCPGKCTGQHVRFSTENPGHHFCTECCIHLCYGRRELADDSRRSSPFCPLCNTKKERSELDFHHWDYDRDIGVQLCRGCHEKVHDGKKAHVQTEEAPGETTWHQAATQNLLSAHCERFGSVDLDETLFARYNIPVCSEKYSHLKMWVEDGFPSD
jgi:hypothetical protein